MMGSTKLEALSRITSPKPRKGASEAHIYAINQRARMTAALVAGVRKAGR